MSHLVLVLFAVVRQHVDHQHPAARLEHAVHFGQRAHGLRDVMQDQRQHRHIQLPIVDRQRFHVAAPNIDVSHALQSAPCGLHHVGGAIDGDHLGDVRGQQFADLAGATAKIAHRQLRVEQGE